MSLGTQGAGGREEGVKDRPCAINFVVQRGEDPAPLVRVFPISHTVLIKLNHRPSEDIRNIPAIYNFVSFNI